MPDLCCRKMLSYQCCFSQGIVPHCRDDGAWLRDDRGDHAVLVWLHGREKPGRQDCHNISTVLWAAVITVPLRLRHACCQGCAVGSWKSQVEISRWKWEYSGGCLHSTSRDTLEHYMCIPLSADGHLPLSVFILLCRPVVSVTNWWCMYLNEKHRQLLFCVKYSVILLVVPLKTHFVLYSGITML